MAKFLNLLKLRGFTSPSDAAVEISAATDSASASRLRIDAGGKLTWGDGTNAGDTNLYRQVANVLKTDDYFVTTGGLTVESYQITTNGASTGNTLVFDGTKFTPGNVTGGAAGSTYVTTIGNGASTTFAVTHNLNTRDVFVQVRGATSPYEVIDVQWEATSTSVVTFNFGTPPATNSVRVAIYAAVTGDNVAIPLDGLTDVVITAPEEFQGLSYDGTNWVNSHIPLVSYVRNAEATTITTGTCVYLFGSTGDHATVKRADNSSDTTSSKTIGVAGANITASNNGPIITRGYVDGIDLSVGYTPGDILWLGTNGAFTKTKPTAPDHLVFIGVVVRATNNGIIYVATQNGYELDEIHNVSTVGASAGQFLKYDGSLWVNDYIDLGTDTVGSYVASLVAGTGVTLSNNSGEGATPTIAIGQAVGTSDSPSFAGLTIGGSAPAIYVSTLSNYVSFGTSVSIPNAQVGIKSVSTSFTPLVIQGASGQTAYLLDLRNAANSSVAYVSNTGDIFSYSSVTGASVSGTTIAKGAILASDTDLTLRYGTSGAPSQNANITVNRGTSSAVSIRWNESTDKWQFTNDGVTYKDLGSGGVTVSDTVPSSPATGDMWYESDTGSLYAYYDSQWIEIGPGAVYDQIIGTIQAKGDLLVGSASQSIARLGVGANGTRLAADSAETTGVKWVSDTQNTVIDAKGDLLVGVASDTVARLPVGTNGQILVADSSQSGGIGWTEQNTRNILYNGSMQVAQRGTTANSKTTGDYYTADRFYQDIVGGTWNITVENDAPTGSGFRKSLKFLIASGASASPHIANIQQRLEGQDLQAFRKGTASAQQFTISFWVKSNVTGTYIFELYDADNTRQVSKAYTISSSGVWEYKTLTLPADTTGAFDNDNALSLYVVWWLSASSVFTSGSLNTSWNTATTANRVVGQVSVSAANNNYFQITGVQLNVGGVSAPFEFKSYGRELAECQRYYRRYTSGLQSGAYTAFGSGWVTTAAVSTIFFPWGTTFRTAPSIATSAADTFYIDRANGNGTCTAISVSASSDISMRLAVTSNTATGTTGQGVLFLQENVDNAFIEASAEL
jgi:hypothetical protein